MSSKTKDTPAPEARAGEPTQADILHAINNDPNRGNAVPDAVPPVLTALDPATAAIGDPTFTVYLTGEGFDETSVIVFAGQDEPTTLEEDGTLSTGVNMDYWHGPDAVPVGVRNGSAMSNTLDFVFTVAPEADQDELEDELEEAVESGDAKVVRKPGPAKRRR